MNNFKRIFALSGMLAGAMVGPALANCDTDTLSGPYASRTQGSVIGVFDAGGVLHPLATPQVLSGIGLLTFDGNGAFVREDIAVSNGNVQGSPTPLSDTGFRTGQSGTYKIDTDCTGSLSLSQPGGVEIQFGFVVADSGRTLYSVVNSEHIPSLPAAIVPAGTSCDAGVGCSIGVNVLVDYTKVFTSRR
jgi:hypothetical protein